MSLEWPTWVTFRKAMRSQPKLEDWKMEKLKNFFLKKTDVWGHEIPLRLIALIVIVVLIVLASGSGGQ